MQYIDDNKSTDARIAQLLSDLTFAGALVVLFGYGAGIDGLFRPIADGPATNPLTVVLFFMSAIVTHGLIGTHKPLPVFIKLLFVGLILSGFRLLEGLYGISLSTDAIVTQLPTSVAHNNVTGLHTAMFFVAYFLMMLAHIKSHDKLWYLSWAIALSTLVVALFGYVFDMPALYGHMAVTTLVLGVVQLVSGFFLCAQHAK